ncbi:hypothetical protein B0T14DRAFT_509568 [Immersiella caudata]|uniref:Uncharacterized protein n=1 Tax=Immersiella caudata TaxID=314043 RepID=A0AA39X3Q5_9PEZI|nr:hypothetical protein B0T14DRAFT_509568 [Immersiella caudata]
MVRCGNRTDEGSCQASPSRRAEHPGRESLSKPSCFVESMGPGRTPGLVSLWEALAAAGLRGGQRHEAIAGGEPGRWGRGPSGIQLCRQRAAGSKDSATPRALALCECRIRSLVSQSGETASHRRRSEVHCAECVHSLPSW